MNWTWVRWVDSESDNPEKILQGIAEELLRQQNWPSGEVKQDVHRDVLTAVNDQGDSKEFLASAQGSRDTLVEARNAAKRELGRPELAGWGIAGALAAYLGLFLGHLGSGTGLGAEILTALAIALGARVAWKLRLRRRHQGYIVKAEEQWQSDLRETVLRPFIRRQKNQQSSERFNIKMVAHEAKLASYGREPKFAVLSAAMQKVADTAHTIGSGSIGISGPRGVGKSTILNKFETRSDPGKRGRDIRVSVAAPVDYDAREFIIHLFTELCLKVQAEAQALSPMARALSPMAVETRRQLNELRFLRTYSRSWGSGLPPAAIFNLTGTLTRERAQQPAGLPAIVAQFRAYSERVAKWNRSDDRKDRRDRKDREDQQSGRVIICIDEMDKIRDGDRAEQFLNDIKAIFDVPGCLYLVSISEDAMTVFASRTPAIRTAFDSAFDEIISVRPMTFKEARELLDLRVTGVPLPFLALCHVLAGGVPRELIRVAQALVHVAQGPGSQEPGLPSVTRELIKDRCEVMQREAILQLGRSGASDRILLPLHQPHWPGRAPEALTQAGEELSKTAKAAGNDECTKMCQDVAAALSFYAAVIELFVERPDDVVASLQQRDQRIDDLAIARHAMRMNSDLAQALLTKYRDTRY